MGISDDAEIMEILSFGLNPERFLICYNIALEKVEEILDCVLAQSKWEERIRLS